jgi:hypothetical protein
MRFGDLKTSDISDVFDENMLKHIKLERFLVTWVKWKAALERLSITWKHVIDKKSLHINKLEQVLIVQMIPSERDML